MALTPAAHLGPDETTARSAIQPLQELAWGQYRDVLIGAQHQEVLIACHDGDGLSCDGGGEDDVVVLIPADASGQGRRVNDTHVTPQAREEVVRGRARVELSAKCLFKFVEQQSRRCQQPAGQRTVEGFMAQALGDEGCNEHVRIEDDRQDTMANTSSSV